MLLLNNEGKGHPVTHLMVDVRRFSRLHALLLTAARDVDDDAGFTA